MNNNIIKMEPQFSVLLYSKYSNNSDKLMNIITTSGVDFKSILQFLCIDNEKIRNQIVQNQDIDVSSVPCILLIFSDGLIEKYDGIKAFQWVEDIIKQHSPQPSQQEQEQQRQQRQAQQRHQEQQRQEQQRYEQLRKKEEILLQKEKKIEEDEIILKNKLIQQNYSNVKNRKKKVKGVNKLTSIDELEEDPQDSDRYNSLEPPKSIRSDSGNYRQDEELFSGPQTDMRKPKQNSVKKDDSNDIMLKAKELAKSREQETSMGRPM